MGTRIAVWIDHHHARVFDVHADPLRHHHTATERTVTAPHHRAHRHQRGHDGEGHEHPQDVVHFFAEVRRLLAGAEALFILGPASAKHELVAHLDAHDRRLAATVIGVETVDHPTDREIVALAAERFLRQTVR